MIFLNSEGERTGIGTELAEFLNYVETNRPTDAFTKNLENAVQDVNRDTEWRRAIMTLEMKYLDYQYMGMKQGIQQGMKQGLEQGRTEGRVKGRTEGIAEGQLQMLTKLLDSGAISIKEAADAYGTTEENMEKLLRKQ